MSECNISIFWSTNPDCHYPFPVAPCGWRQLSLSGRRPGVAALDWCFWIGQHTGVRGLWRSYRRHNFILLYMSDVKCHIIYMYTYIYIFFLQRGGASRRMVCYQWGIPNLDILRHTIVYLPSYAYPSINYPTHWNVKKCGLKTYRKTVFKKFKK